MELSKGIKEEKMKDNLIKFISRTKVQETFHLEITPPHNISCPNVFNVVDENIDNSEDDVGTTNLRDTGANRDKNKNSSLNPESDDPNVVRLQLNFRNPVKEYSATVIMKNDDKTDLRMYELVITILPKVFKATIQMKTPARLPLEQNIPVSNPTDKETKIKIVFQNVKGEHAFSTIGGLTIRPHATSHVPVKFNPTWKGEYSCKITLSNP